MFWNYLWSALLSVEIINYMATKKCNKMIEETEEKEKRRKRIEELKDVLTEEEQEILMNL